MMVVISLKALKSMCTYKHECYRISIPCFLRAPIPLNEQLYAQPNGQKTAAVEDDEHREGPANAPKKKNVKVKKKPKKDKDKSVCFSSSDSTYTLP